jgi:hypothetical protein
MKNAHLFFAFSVGMTLAAACGGSTNGSATSGDSGLPRLEQLRRRQWGEQRQQ